MKPDSMERTELLDRVMNNYRRFYMRKSFLEYPWIRDKVKRKYMLGCLKAFLKSGFERKFYDLGRVGYWGPQSKKNVDFGFDANRTKEATIAAASDDAIWSTMHFRKMERKAARAAQKQQAATFKACGGGTEQLEEEQTTTAETVS